MMKMLNYDSAFYGAPNNLKRNLTSREYKKPSNHLDSATAIRNSKEFNRPTVTSSSPSNKINIDSSRNYALKQAESLNNLSSRSNNTIPPKPLRTSKSINEMNVILKGNDQDHFNSPSFQQLNSNRHNYYDNDVVNNNNNDDKLNNGTILVSNKLNKNYLLQMKKKFKNKITVNLSGTKFDIIKSCCEAVGCKVVNDEDFDCNLIWNDTKVSVECISEMKSFQRYNHFVAMSEISRKDALARNMSKMYKVLPNEFDFVPKTWIMPAEYSNLVSYSLDLKKTQQKRTFIMKPSNGAMGHGIKLYKNVEKIQPLDNYIVQEYISNPYLLDDFKFDLRIYALVTSCDPLRAFIFNNGLVRLGTEKYQEPTESNIDHLYMHLTNYSVNKRNKLYDEGDPNGETGTKRSLKYLFDHLSRKNIDTQKVWKSIQNIILKTLLVAEPYLFHTYKMCRPGQIPGTESVCFEILGFDILLDDHLKPWVIEVNRCPSFGANQQIDFDIKSRLLIDSLELLHFRVSDRQRSLLIEKSEAKRRLYNLNNSDNSTKSTVYISGNNNSSSNLANTIGSVSYSHMRKFKSKEKRKQELIEQIKLLRREQRRQEYENRNLGNFSRLFPIDDRFDMDFYLNILNTSFNLFYPIGKHCLWRKNYERIKEDELLFELAECDEKTYGKYEQHKIFNEYLKDDYMSTDSEESDREEEKEEFHENNRIKNSVINKSHHYNHNENNKYRVNRDITVDYKELKSNTSYNDRDNEIFNKKYDRDKSSSRREAHELDRQAYLDKSQPKVSTSTYINNEHIKANRVNTLLNAVSSTNNSNQMNKKQVNALTNRRLSRQLSKQTESEIVGQETLIESVNSNELIDTVSNNLLKQISQHSNKQRNQAKPFQNNLSSNLINYGNSNLNENNIEIEKDVEDEISNNNTKTLNIAVLKLLNQLEIKFPGKTNEQTKILLQKIYTKFETYKSKLGNYWMVKLDDTKRSKILNIVRSNIVVILQKVFLVNSVDNLRLFKIFVKLLNRMLWMHGQGLWNCFISSNNSSWESIFSKSSFTISEVELKCCFRIVELCKDCVLIVYQYAFEQKPENEANYATNNQTNQSNSLIKFKNVSSSTSNLSSKTKKIQIN